MNHKPLRSMFGINLPRIINFLDEIRNQRNIDSTFTKSPSVDVNATTICTEIEAIQSEWIEKFAEFQTSFDFKILDLFSLSKENFITWNLSHNFECCEQHIETRNANDKRIS